MITDKDKKVFKAEAEELTEIYTRLFVVIQQTKHRSALAELYKALHLIDLAHKDLKETSED